MKKILILLFVLISFTATAQLGYRYKNPFSSQDFRSAPSGQPLMLDNDKMAIVAPLPASSISGQIPPENGAGLPIDPTPGSTLWVNSDGEYEFIAPNTSDTLKVQIQWGTNKPYYAATISATTLGLRNGDGLMLGSDGVWRNIHDAHAGWGIRQARRLQKNTIGETFPSVLCQGASTIQDGVQKCAVLEIPFTDTIRSISFISNIQGVFTGDQTNSLQVYRLDSTSGGMTKVAETANDANIWKHAIAEYVTVPFASAFVANRDSIYYGCALRNDDGTGSPVAAQIGHATSVGSGNLGIMTADYPHSMKPGFTKSAQNSASSSFNISTGTAIGNLPWFRVNRQ